MIPFCVMRLNRSCELSMHHRKLCLASSFSFISFNFSLWYAVAHFKEAFPLLSVLLVLYSQPGATPTKVGEKCPFNSAVFIWDYLCPEMYFCKIIPKIFVYKCFQLSLFSLVMAASGKCFGFKPAGEIWILYFYITRNKNHVGSNQGRTVRVYSSFMNLNRWNRNFLLFLNMWFEVCILKEKKDRKV